MLTDFTVENYRAFARPQTIEIRPLTLFFGWNSGGKSALVRFLPLLAESLLMAGPPIWLAGDVGRKSTWQELVCKATGRNSLKFGLHWNALDAIWEVNGDLEGRWQESTNLSILDITSGTTVSREDSRVTEWNGLIPTLSEQSGTPIENKLLGKLRPELARLANEIQWLSGVRSRPPRVISYTGAAAPRIRADGSDAIEHLVAAQLTSTAHPVLESTRTFFQALGQQLVLDNPADGTWRAMLQPLGGQKTHVNICDTGEGFAQAIPVLVALARSRFGGPKLLCIEQPELHLHTKAQIELAAELIKAATANASPRLLLETHSEILLTSVQLAIARGEISSDDVVVYWVESQPDGTSDTVKVEFDSNGAPTSNAMISAFEEAIQLGQELMRIQLPRTNR